ncbi:hypothetical protein F442_13663, partial [Phytophthora nicotianae P10297]
AASTSLCSDKIAPRFEILLPNRERPTVIPITHHTDDRRQGYVSPDEVDENEVAIESRRKRIRLTQARYRQKLLDKPKRLELAIQQLKEQTQHLEYECNQIVGGLSPQKRLDCGSGVPSHLSARLQARSSEGSASSTVDTAAGPPRMAEQGEEQGEDVRSTKAPLSTEDMS